MPAATPAVRATSATWALKIAAGREGFDGGAEERVALVAALGLAAGGRLRRDDTAGMNECSFTNRGGVNARFAGYGAGSRARGWGRSRQRGKGAAIWLIVGLCPDRSTCPVAHPRTREPATRDPGAIVTDMLDATQQQGLVTRLNRIEGQVRGIRRMVQESRLCVEILQQLAAAEAALNRISLAVLKVHVERCVPTAVDQGEPERSRRRLAELVDIFDRFAK